MQSAVVEYYTVKGRLIANQKNKFMMGYGYGGWSMMNGAGLFGGITWLVIIVDLVLVGIWLWQQISKK